MIITSITIFSRKSRYTVACVVIDPINACSFIFAWFRSTFIDICIKKILGLFSSLQTKRKVESYPIIFKWKLFLKYYLIIKYYIIVTFVTAVPCPSSSTVACENTNPINAFATVLTRTGCAIIDVYKIISS